MENSRPPDPVTVPSPRMPFAKVIVGVLIVAVALTAGVALVVRERRPSGSRDVSAVLGAPRRFIGERIRIAGRVEAVLSAKSFVLRDDSARMLVLDVAVIPAIDADLDGTVTDERVLVTGVVQTVPVDELETYTGELTATRYQALADRPVLFADSYVPR